MGGGEMAADDGMGRRAFLKTAVTSTVAAAMAPGLVRAGRFQSDSLQVWSCGGLSEAFGVANRVFWVATRRPQLKQNLSHDRENSFRGPVE